ncbi:hypothetical protein [Eubacterium aggregans]|uniref:hypothetical protein n=1 Tax=Eubacterium aggregans TaxID=81409 RepID=UPI003F2C0433
MVILYITHISYNLTTGLSYSIPSQTAAQSSYDQVLWLNTIKTKDSAWVNNPVLQYWDKPLKLKLFPHPFHQPDLVLFESFYQTKDVVFAKELRRNSIPYIIVPRGALTDGAQHKKRIKKVIGNALVFKKFSKKAAAIHFLTEQERNASSKRWNSHSFVLPNGTYPRKATKKFCVDDKVKNLSFIGRLDAYHKGLDLLLSACKDELELLTKNHIEIHIYGNDNRKNIDYLNTLISENNLTQLVFFYTREYLIKKKKMCC